MITFRLLTFIAVCAIGFQTAAASGLRAPILEDEVPSLASKIRKASTPEQPLLSENEPTYDAPVLFQNININNKSIQMLFRYLEISSF